MINKTLTLKPNDRFILNNKERIIISIVDTFDWDYHGHHDPYTEVTWCYADKPDEKHTDRYDSLIKDLNYAAGKTNQWHALTLCDEIRNELRWMKQKGVNPEEIDAVMGKLDEFAKSLSEIE